MKQIMGGNKYGEDVRAKETDTAGSNTGRSHFLIRGNRAQKIATANKWRSTKHRKPIIKNNFLIYDVSSHSCYASNKKGGTRCGIQMP